MLQVKMLKENLESNKKLKNKLFKKLKKQELSL